MSGLVGVFDPSGVLPDDRAINRALKRMERRGATTTSVFREGPVVLGHAVFDPSDDGRHPGFAENQETGGRLFADAIFDEVDISGSRGSELVRRLETNPDTTLAGLRGDFAVVHWSPKNRRLLLARDHLGKRPLLYVHSGSRLMFATVPSALIELGFSAEPDLDAVQLLLQLGTMPAPWSGWKGISRLRQGQRLIVSESGVDCAFFWNYELVMQSPIPEQEHVKRLRQSLEDSVRDSVAGCSESIFCMSGGIDSTAIAALARRISGTRIRTVCLGFRGGAGDDRPFARRASEYLDTDHQEIEVTPEMIDRNLEMIFDSLEVPSLLSYTEYFLSKQIGGEAKLVVTGEMADSQFAGTSPFQTLNWLDQYRRIPVILRRSLACGIRNGLPRRTRIFGKHPVEVLGVLDDLDRSSAADRYLRVRSVFSETETADLLGLKKVSAPARDYLAEMFAPYEEHPMNAMLAGHILHEAPNEYLADDYKHSVPIVYRSPYACQRVAEVAAKIPWNLKVKGGVRKHILIEAVREILPPESISRPKMGFAFPMDEWLRGPLRRRVDDSFSAGQLASFLDHESVSKVRQDYLGGKGLATFRQVWLLMVLSMWSSTHFAEARTIPY